MSTTVSEREPEILQSGDHWWFIHWPDSKDGYIEGPYTNRSDCEFRIREVAATKR